jgi:hypothetical protein
VIIFGGSLAIQQLALFHRPVDSAASEQSA